MGRSYFVSKKVAWIGLVLGWAGILFSDKFSRPWQGATLLVSWMVVFFAWIRVSPCAGGTCADKPLEVPPS